MKKKVFFLNVVLLALAFTTSAMKYGLHFDNHGNIISPDQEYFDRAMDDEKAGFKKSALKNFLISAEYGNQMAISLVALYQMQDNNYVEALAWYQLVDTGLFENGVMIDEIIGNLKSILKPKEIQKADKLTSELSEVYGSHATLAKRASWKSELKFTGTHLKGYIPPFLRVRLNSGIVISGDNLRKQVDDFVFNYEFNLPNGEVTLDEINVIENEE